MRTHKQHSNSNDLKLTNAVRVIGGQWRGRKIYFADSKGVRPTPDRIRETLFNWLMHDITGARCLDAFAGSGALGIEALSRGALSVDFVDNQAEVIRYIEHNLKEITAENYQLYQQDFMSWLKAQQQQYHLVFLDPPFSDSNLTAILATLMTSNCLAQQAKIYLESDKNLEDIALPEGLEWLKLKKAGHVYYGLVQLL